MTTRSLRLAFHVTGLISLVASPVFAQAISPSAQRQIAEILAAKASFTAAESKMSSHLALAARLANNRAIGMAASMVNPGTVDSAGRVMVDINAQVTPQLLAQIAAVGGTIQSAFPQHQAVRAFIPAAQMPVIAGSRDVMSVREADRALVSSSGAQRTRLLGGKGYRPFIGALTSQGYVTHQANSVVNGLGINGSGVRVGVLSDSASPAGVAALVASGDLAPGTTVLPGQAGSGSDEGTAMMEIVQDMAPGAQIFFATAFSGVASFANNILALRAAGCDIIVDDVSYFNEGAFQDGPIAQAVNQVVASGALYFSSAANSGNLTLGTSGTWEGDFLSAGPVSGPVALLEGAATLHNFGTVAGPQVANALTGASTFISLKWSDPLGKSGNDYDLFILNSTGTTVKGFSIAAQTGTQDPYEAVSQGTNCGTSTASGYCPATGDLVVLVLYSGSPRALRVDTNRGRLSIGTSGSTYGHNAAASTITMAATYWNSARTGTRAFTGAANPIETFSSDGPRKIFYNPDGTMITPGNVLFSTNGGTTLAKPDLTASDGTSGKTPGFLPFFGTSAASPHAAGIAALVKSARPSLTNVQIRQILFDTALDNMAPGVDRDGGHGVMMALPAVKSALK